MWADELVVREGDRVAVWGRVWTGTGGDDWLRDLSGPTIMERSPSKWTTEGATRLIGADVQAAHDASRPGVVPGLLQVVGVWRGETIIVETQTSHGFPRTVFAKHTNPPCAAPAGGWAHGLRDIDTHEDRVLLDALDELTSAGTAVTTSFYRPSRWRIVVVIAATDVGAVTRRLGPRLPGQLCVVPSRYTVAQVGDVTAALRANAAEWRLGSVRSLSDESAQPFVQVSLHHVSPQIARWANAQPAGLLTLKPAFTQA